MRLRRLGRTGLMVSELSFGAARGATDDPRGFDAALGAAIDLGINLVDTAPGYEHGASEKALGRALNGRDDVLIETKYCPYENYLPEAAYNGSPGALTASAEASLRRLRRDHIDILLGHGIRTLATLEQFMNDGCYEAMVRLREQGKVRFIGISELSEADGRHEVLRQALAGDRPPFDVVMLTLNILLQTAAESVLPLCAAGDVGTVVMMPLNQASRQSGLVSTAAALECVRRHVAQGNLPAQPPYTEPGLFDFLAPFSVPEAALRFVLAHEVTTCCVGMRSKARAIENLRALDPPGLEPAQFKRLRELFGGICAQVR